MESVCQSSVQALPRQFGDLTSRVTPLPFSKTEQGLTRFDGGSELEALREEPALSEKRETFLAEAKDEDWARPLLPVRDSTGAEVQRGAAEAPRESVYGKRLDAFAVAMSGL